VLRRCVWSRNIKNGCSIYIYDISRLRVKQNLLDSSLTDKVELKGSKQNIPTVTSSTTNPTLKTQSYVLLRTAKELHYIFSSIPSAVCYSKIWIFSLRHSYPFWYRKNIVFDLFHCTEWTEWCERGGNPAIWRHPTSWSNFHLGGTSKSIIGREAVLPTQVLHLKTNESL